MRQITTKALVLRRTNYGEADRIVTFLTPQGKVRAIVKGVRRSKSKLAGGVELFSENTITYMEARGDLARIVSTRLEVHWDGFLGDLQRMMFGYEAMKLIDKAVEDEAEGGYFELLRQTFEVLSNSQIPREGVECWFYLRLLGLEGRQPNLETSSNGQKLKADGTYQFSVDEMCFIENTSGIFRADHIKLLRLLRQHSPGVLGQIKQANELVNDILPILKSLINTG